MKLSPSLSSVFDLTRTTLQQLSHMTGRFIQKEESFMKLKNTKLQLIEFGDDSSDKYYCLVDLNVSPAGLNLQKMRLTNPRDIDREFRKSGCLMMFTGEEIEELVNRGDLDRNELHESLFRLAISEGVIKSG